MVLQQVEAAVQLPAHHQQVAQLAVVDAHVGVDQVRRHPPVRDRVLQVVEHHVGVVQIGLGILGEPVAVAALARDAHGCDDVLIEHVTLPVGPEQAPYLGFGEADHLVEVGAHADVGCFDLLGGSHQM